MFIIENQKTVVNNKASKLCASYYKNKECGLKVSIKRKGNFR